MEKFDDLKFYYFNLTVLGDPIRFLFHYLGLKFEDVRVEFDQWPALKPTLGWGKLPVVKFGDVELTQSATIARYFARKFNLEGENELEAARASEYVDCCTDFRQAWRLYNFEADEAKKAEHRKNFVEVAAPNYLGKFNKIVGESGGNYLLKSGISYADFFLVVFLELFEKTIDENLLRDYPNLQNLKKNVNSLPQLANYLASRPTTKF